MNDRRLKVLGWLLHGGGLASLLIGGAIYHFVITGLLTHHTKQNGIRIAELEEQLTSSRDVRSQQQSLSDTLRELEQRAETIRQRIPDQSHEAEFLNQVAQAAQARGLTIQNYTRGDVTVTATHSQLDIRLVGAGDYASICGFLEELTRLPRVATVQQLNVTVPEASDIYPLEMLVTLYFGAREVSSGGSHG